MTEYNFSVKRENTFNGAVFTINTAIGIDTLANFPATGVTGEIYEAIDTHKFYKWVSNAYVETTDKKPANLTGAIITAEFRRGFRQPLALTMAIGTGLTVIDAAAGKFQIDSQKINIDPGRYQYEIKIVFPSGVTKTWIYGVMVVTENINDE